MVPTCEPEAKRRPLRMTSQQTFLVSSCYNSYYDKKGFVPHRFYRLVITVYFGKVNVVQQHLTKTAWDIIGGDS